MNSRAVVVLIVVLAVHVSALDSVVKSGAWNYGNTSWSEYEVCREGKEQSPINVEGCRARSSCDRPEIMLHKSTLSFHAETEHYSLDCENDADSPCGTMRYGNMSYEMLKVHGHSPSENTLNGQSYPVELHFVHASADGDLAVLGVFYKFGRFNPEFQTFVDAAIEQKTVEIDLSQMWYPHSMMCSFAGSLTTPPCTEGVSWHVSWGVLEISTDQYYNYRELSGQEDPALEPHNRPVQPLNDRDVSCVH